MGIVGTLGVSGTTSLNGNVNIGNANTDEVGFYGVTTVSRQVLAKLGNANANSNISGGFTEVNTETAINNAVDAAYDAIQSKLNALIQDLVDVGLLSLT